MLQRHPHLQLIASGGVRSPEDVKELEQAGCCGAIVGKAIYEDFHNLSIWRT
jgi:phosphoribosylformimino-5-aminoimidazole carboxamide ribotide isomerase